MIHLNARFEARLDAEIERNVSAWIYETNDLGFLFSAKAGNHHCAVVSTCHIVRDYFGDCWQPTIARFKRDRYVRRRVGYLGELVRAVFRMLHLMRESGDLDTISCDSARLVTLSAPSIEQIISTETPVAKTMLRRIVNDEQF